MNYNIAVLAGDGIGPEICTGAIKVLNKTGQKFGHTFNFEYLPIGGAAIDACGTPLPDITVEKCLKSDSVLLGAVGGYKWDDMPVDKRPEKGLLGIRKAMGLYSNIRPAKLWPSLAAASPLKSELVKNGIEIIIVRELTGGIYFGERGSGKENGEEFAWDTEKYSDRLFGMFGGELERVRLECKNSLAGVMIDRFGRDVSMRPVRKKDSFVISFDAFISPQLMGWIFGLGSGVKILGPESLKEMFRERLTELQKEDC